MTGLLKTFATWVLLLSTVWTVRADFAGSSISSDSSGTRSVLISGKNGAAGAVTTRFGGNGGGSAVATRIGSPNLPVGVGAGPAGTFASAGGPAGAYAGPGGAYAGAGGAYAGAGGAFASAGGFGNPWSFPYWNAPGSYNYDYPQQQYPYNSYYDGGYNSGEVGVYSATGSNGISTRFANVAPGGQATIIEQNGNEAPRIYTYRGSSQSKN